MILLSGDRPVTLKSRQPDNISQNERESVLCRDTKVLSSNSDLRWISTPSTSQTSNHNTFT